jgi:hypothetical protein
MAVTFLDLVNEIDSTLHAYTRVQEQSTHLLASAADVDLILSVANASRVPTSGQIEIDDELLWVDSVASAANTLAIAPYGRGFQGTAAAAHAISSRVIVAPEFPRIRIKRAINDTILGLSNQLFGIGSTVFTCNAAVLTYPLPATVNDIITVAWQPSSPTLAWIPVNNWRLNTAADTTAFPTGVSIDLGDWMQPGRNIKVTYTTDTTELTANTDLFTASGLAEFARDIVVYGACWRLTSGLDMGRIDTRAVEARELEQTYPSNTSRTLSMQFYNMYKQRMADERARLLSQYPITLHYQG